MRETKARFLLNALSLGACLGVLTGVLEALYLIGTKQSLFATGVRDVGLLFDGVVIKALFK